MTPDRPDLSDTYAGSVRRDAWRAQLLHEEEAQKSAQRRRTAGMGWAIAAGIAIGLLGSVHHFI
jgi:hypothetical protein